MPKLPRLSKFFDVFDQVSSEVDVLARVIDDVGRGIDKIADALGPNDKPPSLAEPHASQEQGFLPSAIPSNISQEMLPDEEIASQDIATACVPCAIGHFSGAARLLNEAIRFRDDGMESNQVLDDIAGAIGELNALERVDLTPERLQRTPAWERIIADESLRESRKFRHRLEGIGSMAEIEKTAADAESYYKKLNRQWYRERFKHLGAGKSEAIAERIGEK